MTLHHNSIRLYFAGLIAVSCFALTSLTARAQTVWTVTNTNDSGSGSLRNAIAQASNGDTINFDPSLNGQTITLASYLDVNKSLTIHGLGADKLAVSGNDQTMVIFVDAGQGQVTVAIDSLAITHGRSGAAGAIYNSGTLTLTRCLFSGNQCTGANAGALNNIYNMTLIGCTVTGNFAAQHGGGIANFGPSGGSNIVGIVVVINSTISNNSAVQGGGVYTNAGAVSLTNCTLSGNSASFSGGGVYTYDFGSTTIENTIIANSVGGNFEVNNGMVTTDSSSLCDDNSCFSATQKTSAQINLQPLADNGGPTQTIALGTGSAAIDMGNDSAAPATDQRGVTRPQGAHSDVGAYEVESTQTGPNFVVTLKADTDSGLCGVTFCSLREAVAHANSLSGSQTITFAPALAGQTIPLSSASGNQDIFQMTSTLTVFGNITIQGPSTAPGISLAVDPNAQRRHFAVGGGATLTLANLTLSGGKALNSGAPYGGSILSFGSLIVQNCTFTGNASGANGGAIESWGGSPLLAIDNSTFSGNSALGAASAIDTGALAATLRYVTITNNTAGSGNALALEQNPATMINSIIAGNTSDGVASISGGVFTAQSTNNLLGSGGSAGLTNGQNGNQVGVNPSNLLFGSLANNGGPTPTIALLPGSPAIDAGISVSGITTDQRGITRPQGASPDIGAFELVPPPAPTQVVSRKLHNGVPFDINLPLTGSAGVECRSGGGTNDYQVVFTFPGTVAFTGAAVTAGAGSVSSSSGSGTSTVTVNLTGITNAQRIAVTLSSVNNGTSTGDVAVQMGVLVGDTNGDGSVNAADIGQTKSQSGNAVTASNFREDVNADGNINASDVGLVKSKSGTALP